MSEKLSNTAILATACSDALIWARLRPLRANISLANFSSAPSSLPNLGKALKHPVHNHLGQDHEVAIRVPRKNVLDFLKVFGRFPCFSAWKTRWWPSFFPNMWNHLAQRDFWRLNYYRGSKNKVLNLVWFLGQLELRWWENSKSGRKIEIEYLTSFLAKKKKSKTDKLPDFVKF